jgi:hypothetical protein
MISVFSPLEAEIFSKDMGWWKYPNREVTKEDLKGVLDLLAYFRVSTDDQKLDRQEDALDEFMEDFQVKLHPPFIGLLDDTGLSGITGLNRKFGKLGWIIKTAGFRDRIVGSGR